jgi:hypothetical protein
MISQTGGLTSKMVRRWLIGCLAVLLFLALVFGLIPFLIEDQLWDGKAAAVPRFWWQTFAGNWSPDPRPDISPWAFAFSAVLAVFLNNAFGLLAGAAIWRWAIERRTLMRLGQVLATRDAMNKQALFRVLADDPDSIALINTAFEQGAEDWKKHIVSVFGEDEAKRLLSKLGEEL